MRQDELGGCKRGFLETAKLRLIILGALRGFIKPGYAYGVCSVIREELLTRALARELDGQAFISRGVLESSIVPVVEGMRRPAAYRQAIGYLLQGNALQRLMPGRNVRQIHMSQEQQREIAKVATLLKVLKRTDFSDRMAAMLKTE